MSLYTTGELASKCGVSVRTVQYYDERGILVPTDLTEGDLSKEYPTTMMIASRKTPVPEAVDFYVF